MIDVKAALSYLNNLWVDEADNVRGKPLPAGRIVGAFKEATSIPIFYQNDNTLARLVMRKYDPRKAKILDEGLLNIGWNPDFETGTAYFIDDGLGFIDPRWCILYGDVAYFIPPSAVLPDYLRYADLVALQYLYQHLQPSDDGPNTNLAFGILNKMYGLIIPGFMNDMATPKEACTTYKLLLFGMCALRHNHMGLVKQLLETVSQFQVTPENESTLRNWRADEMGGIKTEYIPPEWDGLYPQLLVLANCETTSLAILLQDEYDYKALTDGLMIAGGIGAGAIGASSLTSFFSKKRVKKQA